MFWESVKVLYFFLIRIAVQLKSALKDFLKGKSFQERDETLFQVNS